MLAVLSSWQCGFVVKLPVHRGSLGRREAIALLVGAAATGPSAPALAARASMDSSRYYADAGQEPSPERAKRFIGQYDDQLHPSCERRISVDGELKVSELTGRKYFAAEFQGTDVVPQGVEGLVFAACDEASMKKTGRQYTFSARIAADGESVDAGDNIHVGRWHPAGPPEQKEDWVGIKWKDGNRWVKKKA